MMRNAFDDWWLDERYDSVGLTEEGVPVTVEQWFARFDENVSSADGDDFYGPFVETWGLISDDNTGAMLDPARQN